MDRQNALGFEPGHLQWRLKGGGAPCPLQDGPALVMGRTWFVNLGPAYLCAGRDVVAADSGLGYEFSAGWGLDWRWPDTGSSRDAPPPDGAIITSVGFGNYRGQYGRLNRLAEFSGMDLLCWQALCCHWSTYVFVEHGHGEVWPLGPMAWGDDEWAIWIHPKDRTACWHVFVFATEEAAHKAFMTRRTGLRALLNKAEGNSEGIDQMLEIWVTLWDIVDTGMSGWPRVWREG